MTKLKSYAILVFDKRHFPTILPKRTEFIMKHTSKLTFFEMLLVFALAFLVSFYDVFYSFDSLLRDKLYQQPRGINNKIKIIAIDDKTLRDIGPFGTWPRSRLR